MAPRPLTAAEKEVLEVEFQWLLEVGVPEALRQLQEVLAEASRRFASLAGPSEEPPQQETFTLSGPGGLRAVLTLQGEVLCQAEVSLALPRPHPPLQQLLHVALAREAEPGRLQQIQDCRNHLQQARSRLEAWGWASRRRSRAGPEVLKLMEAVMLQLTRARSRLTTPTTPSLPELASRGGWAQRFSPALPREVLLDLHLNLNRLTLVVYHLRAQQPTSAKNQRPAAGGVAPLHPPGARLEVAHTHKAECPLPWLDDALGHFHVALQLCQHLKEKVAVFSSYWP